MSQSPNTAHTPPPEKPERHYDLYPTTDFYLACYLIFRRAEVARVEALSAARVQFVFKAVPDALVLSYYNHAPLEGASFLDIVAAIRQTRELLYHALEHR